MKIKNGFLLLIFLAQFYFACTASACLANSTILALLTKHHGSSPKTIAWIMDRFGWFLAWKLPEWRLQKSYGQGGLKRF
jgi:hypothetical protein